MKKVINSFKISIPSKSINESFSRVVCAAFVSLADPTVEEISDIKTAVSEAVTNCIVHAYEEKNGIIYISADLFDDNTVRIKIRDRGVGIPDIQKALNPFLQRQAMTVRDSASPLWKASRILLR